MSYVDDLRNGAKIATEETKLDAIEVEPARAPKHPGMRMPMGGPGGIPKVKPPQKAK